MPLQHSHEAVRPVTQTVPDTCGNGSRGTRRTTCAAYVFMRCVSCAPLLNVIERLLQETGFNRRRDLFIARAQCASARCAHARQHKPDSTQRSPHRSKLSPRSALSSADDPLCDAQGLNARRRRTRLVRAIAACPASSCPATSHDRRWPAHCRSPGMAHSTASADRLKTTSTRCPSKLRMKASTGSDVSRNSMSPHCSAGIVLRQRRNARVALSVEPASRSCTSHGQRAMRLGDRQPRLAGVKPACAPLVPRHRRAAAVAALEVGPEGHAVRILQRFVGHVGLAQAQFLALVQADRTAQRTHQRAPVAWPTCRCAAAPPQRVTTRCTSWLEIAQHGQPSAIFASRACDGARGCRRRRNRRSAARSCSPCAGAGR